MMEFNALNLDIRDINACVRTGCKTVEELKQRIADDPEGIRRQLGFATYDRVEDAIVELSENQQPVAIHENPEAHARAYYLRDDTKARLSVIEENYYAVCNNIKEIRDGKLYKELGYKNFEDCCKAEFGIKKVQAYKYIRIAERLPEDFVQSTVQIGTEKLSMLAMLDEPTREAVTETVDVESATVKELKAQITALTAERDENEHAAELLSDEIEGLKENVSRFCREKTEANENLRKKSAEVVKAQRRIDDLEKQIKELESRPIEVAVSEDSAAEIEKLKNDLENVRLQLMQADKHAASKAEQAVALVKDEYEKKLAEAQKSEPDENALDEARFNSFRLMFEEIVDELENLLGTMHDEPRIGYINRLDNYWTDNLLYLKRKGEGAGA